MNKMHLLLLTILSCVTVYALPQCFATETPKILASYTNEEIEVNISISPNRESYYVGQTATLICSINPKAPEINLKTDIMFNFMEENKPFAFIDAPRNQNDKNFTKDIVFTSDYSNSIPLNISFQYSKPGGTNFDIFSGRFRRILPFQNILLLPFDIKIPPIGSAPPNYIGVLDKFTISTSLNKDNYHVDDIVSLIVKLSDIKSRFSITPPELHVTKSFKQYPPRVISKEPSQIVFQYDLIPSEQGTFEISPITASFFNTESGKFEEITTEPIFVNIQEKSEIKEENIVIDFNDNQPASEKDLSVSDAYTLYLYPSESSMKIGNIFITDNNYDIQEEHQEWIRIKVEDKFGWIKKKAISNDK